MRIDPEGNPANPHDWSDPDRAERLAAFLTSADPESAEGPGQFGNYRILREIGRGGHGVVYQAVRNGDHASAALKVIRRDLADPSAPRRLWRELESLQRCRCAAVPRVLEYGTHDDNLFIAYDYIDGVALDEYVGQHAPSVRQRIEALVLACRAVQSVHEHGVIHRDLKPSNLLVTPSGEVRVIDLGTACLQEGGGDDNRTIEGTILGTPAFMSPEQARGEISRVSTRSDVFSLGAIGFKLLTGQTPFSTMGSQHEVLRRVADGEPRRLCDLAPAIPRSLDAVLGKAVAPNPADRFGTAIELIEECQRFLEGRPTHSAAPGALARAWMLARRKPLAAGASVACVACVVIATILGTSAYQYERLASYRQQVILDSADTMILHTQQLGTAGNPAVVMPLRELVEYVRNGGHIDDGLIQFGDSYDRLIEKLEARKRAEQPDAETPPTEENPK